MKNSLQKVLYQAVVVLCAIYLFACSFARLEPERVVGSWVQQSEQPYRFAIRNDGYFVLKDANEARLLSGRWKLRGDSIRLVPFVSNGAAARQTKPYIDVTVRQAENNSLTLWFPDSEPVRFNRN
jgi:hypothetical protein